MSGTGVQLTATPWTATGVTASQLLARVQGEVSYWAGYQQSNGSITDPYTGAVYTSTVSGVAYGAAVLVSAGETSYLNEAVAAMNWAANHFATTADDSTSDGLEFSTGSLVSAYTLLKKSGLVSNSQLATWASDLGTIKYNPNQLQNNWATYAMNGAWMQYQAGLISQSTATTFIESTWKTYQSQLINSSTDGLYVDPGGAPSSLSVQAVGLSNLADLVAEGYNGASAGAIASAVSEGAATALTIMDPSGQAPAGGRTDDHVFVDAGYEQIDQTLADITSNATLAGQYQTEANLTFQEMTRWENANGTFQVTKNQYNPNLRVGYQTASQFSAYNVSVLAFTAQSYQSMISKTVAEQPAPVQIGGYVTTLPSTFGATFANAGGVGIEIETEGRASPIFGQTWSALGIVRIGQVNWDTRLGPSDGVYNPTTGEGVSFAPTWQSNGSWDHLADHAGNYGGTVTTKIATTDLTELTVVWAPTSGSGPTFTQNLIITPDGMLSRTTETGVAGAWGMTLPIMLDDGKTNMVQFVGGGVASVAYPGGSDAENFIDLNAGATLTKESPIQSTYGDITPVRAVSSAAEQDVFVYPSSSGDPSATAVQSTTTLTSTGYTSDLGWVSGTLYSGRTSAGGYGSSIALSGTGAPDVVFSKPVDFTLQVSNGVITKVETTTAVSATIEGKAYALAANTATTVSGGTPPPQPVLISGPGVTAILTAGETLYDTGGDNVLVFPGSGSVTVSGNTANNGDLFDLRAAMATTNWNGNIATIGQYLTASTSGSNLVVSIHPTGGSTSSILATLTAVGGDPNAFGRFMEHAILTTAGTNQPVFISGPGLTVTGTSGETLYDTGGRNTLILPTTGSITFSGNTLYNSDTFNLVAAMKQTSWDGTTAHLGQYLTTTTTAGGQNLEILLHPSAGSSSTVLAMTFTAVGQSPNTLALFESHGIFH